MLFFVALPPLRLLLEYVDRQTETQAHGYAHSESFSGVLLDCAAMP